MVSLWLHWYQLSHSWSSLWIPSNNKSPKATTVLAVCLSAAYQFWLFQGGKFFWIRSTGVSTLMHLILLSNLIGTVPSAPLTPGRTFVQTRHILPFCLARCCWLIISSPFALTAESSGTATSIIWQVCSCLFTTVRSALLAFISWSGWKLKSYNNLKFSFSKTVFGWCSYHCSPLWNLHFPHAKSQCNAHTTLSCHLLYSVWANFWHPFTMWLIVSSAW